jgi:hypothetical protein
LAVEAEAGEPGRDLGLEYTFVGCGDLGGEGWMGCEKYGVGGWKRRKGWVSRSEEDEV